MHSKKAARSACVIVLGVLFAAGGVCAADETGGLLEVEFPHDSPVLPVHFGLQEPGPTTASVRGASIVVNLHASLLLRNTGTKAISGLTLMVEAPDLTPSGRGSVTVPSLNAKPGEVFPVRINMQLSRPITMGTGKGAMMQLSLDCALFSDLSAYGPDKLQSRRMLTVYELEARRDRRYLANLLETGRLSDLREELNFGLADLNPTQMSLELLREPASSRGAQAVPVGAVAFPSSPVKPLGGRAQIAGNEVRTSQLEVRNISGKPIENFGVGWIVRDARGRDFVAGSIPSSIRLAPVQTASMTQPDTLRFSRPSGEPMTVDALLAFVNNVEFSDGKMWIPSRVDITKATSDPILRRALASSPEQQRLADIYRRKGMSGLQEELKRLN
jgi:hypothetical protein